MPKTKNVVVKWYNKEKGYGFFTLSSVKKDIFFSYVALNAGKFDKNAIEPGQEAVIETGKNDKGVTASVIHSIGDQKASEPAKPEVGKIYPCTLKFFNASKGYGFFISEELDTNIFVHESQISDDQIMDLERDVLYEIKVIKLADKGPEGTFLGEAEEQEDDKVVMLSGKVA